VGVALVSSHANTYRTPNLATLTHTHTCAQAEPADATAADESAVFVEEGGGAAAAPDGDGGDDESAAVAPDEDEDDDAEVAPPARRSSVIIDSNGTRVIVIVRNGSLGLTLKTSQSGGWQQIAFVDGAAKDAGVIAEDLIVEVNGAPMKGKSHQDVVAALVAPTPEVTLKLYNTAAILFPDTADKDAPLGSTLAQATEHAVAARTELEVKGRKDAGASIMSILKKNIGKNLTKISMPVSMNEPLSGLQRMCEELEHCSLLAKAAAAEDPLQRLLYVAAFAVSQYSGTFYRGGRKPFNPLLGETYEYVDAEKKFRFVAEQVSHHPPVAAAFASNPDWEMNTQYGVDTKFRPTKLKLVPSGEVRLRLTGRNETYTWNRVITCTVPCPLHHGACHCSWIMS
jgi:hypothetical protein